jgi:hypothetical protein
VSETVLCLPRAIEDGLAELITEGKIENMYYRAVPGGTSHFKAK